MEQKYNQADFNVDLKGVTVTVTHVPTGTSCSMDRLKLKDNNDYRIIDLVLMCTVDVVNKLG